MRFIIINILLSIITFHSFAQIAGNRLDIPFKNDLGVDYHTPLLGGLNNPQFSEIDLNMDGIMDLFIFDKTGNAILTFINNGTPNQVDYTFAPEYINQFPKTITDWALLRDYNNDGIMDIFSYSTSIGIAGIDLYEGSYNNGVYSFEKVRNYHNDYDLLSYPSASGTIELEIYVSRDDIPAIVDVDQDGDLDVLTFSLVGNKMEWYKNTSVENGWGVDSLYFVWEDPCWGLFIESGTSSDIQVSNNGNQCADLNFAPNTNLHVGSTTAAWDSDNDGDLELLVGDITTQTLTYLKSNASGLDPQPWLDEKSVNFPAYNTSVNMPIFPAAFVLDLNNDGRKDFIAAPNDLGTSLNVDVAWYYQNTSTSGEGIFSLQQRDFINDWNIDLGQGAKPAFFDYNADGLMDIVVGTDGYFVNIGEWDTRLVLFENIGTVNNPQYQLIDDDWLNFSQYEDKRLSPAFGDLDDDGDTDMIVAQSGGQLFFVENTAGAGNVPSFPTIFPNYKSIIGGTDCTPEIVDLDGDGLTDIVTGIKQGRIVFFKNIGTQGSPDFNPDRTVAPNIDGVGLIDVRDDSQGFVDPRGYASPKVFFMDDEPYMLIGSYFNDIYVYPINQSDLVSQFSLDSDGYGDIREGRETSPDMADIDDDGYYEMVVGNYRGGFAIYETDFRTNPSNTSNIQKDELNYTIMPNPTRDDVQVNIEGVNSNEIQVNVFDIRGKLLDTQRANHNISLSKYSSGIYIFELIFEGGKIVDKVIKN